MNEGLRRGLSQLEAKKTSAKRYSTPTVKLGRCLVGSIDDVAEALAMAEDESFR